MKLLRVGTAGSERPALLDADGTLRDLSGVVTDIDGDLLADESALGRIRSAAEAGELPALDAAGLRVGPPVGRIGKIVCIGLNYHDHARETGAEPPASRSSSSRRRTRWSGRTTRCSCRAGPSRPTGRWSWRS